MFWLRHFIEFLNHVFRVVVVAQLEERLLPTSEIRGSNLVIGKIYMVFQLYWKEAGKGQIKKACLLIYDS